MPVILQHGASAGRRTIEARLAGPVFDDLIVIVPTRRRIRYLVREVMTATLSVGQQLEVLDRHKVLEGPFTLSAIHANYDVHPDGKQFVMMRRAEDSDAQLIVIHNWANEVRAKLRGR